MLILPATLERVLARVEAGQIEVHVNEDGRNGSGRGPSGRGRRGSSRQESGGALARVAVCVASLAAGVVLMLDQFPNPGWFCLGLAALAAVSLLFRR
jgi:hypothetical protein